MVKVLLGFVVQMREIERRKMHSKIGFFFFEFDLDFRRFFLTILFWNRSRNLELGF